MNFLAHLHLSNDDESLMVGNFIADGFRGSSYRQLPDDIARGVELHRFIDTFADHSPYTEEARALLREYVGKLAPVAIDMIFDHFLAANFNDYHPLSLEKYTIKVYDVLARHEEHFKPETLYMFSHMRQRNWLLSYASIEGIERAINGLSRRRSFTSELTNSVDVLKDCYDRFESDFHVFYPKIQQAVNEEFK